MPEQPLTLAQYNDLQRSDEENRSVRATIDFLAKRWTFDLDASGRHLITSFQGGGTPSRAEEQRVRENTSRILAYFRNNPNEFRNITGRAFPEPERSSGGRDYSKMSLAEIRGLVDETDPTLKRIRGV